MLLRFGADLRCATEVVALCVGGSLATGDYRAGVSDIDLVAIVNGR
ncbi:nucleotidyltransferase domain-containing protein [Nocardia sp. NBC_00511]